ncbi:MAG TPA: hypothetical protein VFZ41_08005 [Solirubrobacterales bacterium]
MKVEANVVFRFQSGSLAEAGALLDEILQPAQEREDVEVEQINVGTPPRSTPVTLPPVSSLGEYPPGTPR